MNESIEMLEYIHKAANIGRISAENLLKELKEKDNKIKKTLEEINKEYEHFEKETEKILKKNKKEPKNAGIMMDIMNKMGIKKEVKSDNSDPSIASTLIEGITMGNLEIEKRLNNFEKEIDKKTQKIGKEFKQFGEKYIEKLKLFL
ncbi:MAG: hypothetical protein IKF91_00135 [Bacilli bacterium]|nr:hypothetical protein [Bacilli bacterium]